MKVGMVAVAFAAVNVASASVFTMSSTGTVKAGVDDQGVFSAPGTKLNGCLLR
jgi:hypothetical protein